MTEACRAAVLACVERSTNSEGRIVEVNPFADFFSKALSECDDAVGDVDTNGYQREHLTGTGFFETAMFATDGSLVEVFGPFVASVYQGPSLFLKNIVQRL